MQPPDRHPLLGKTTAALSVMLLALAVPYASPRLRPLRIAHAPWDAVASKEVTLEGAVVP